MGENMDDLKWRLVCDRLDDSNEAHWYIIDGGIDIYDRIVRACILNFKGSWDKWLPLVEFAYNNSYQSSI